MLKLDAIGATGYTMDTSSEDIDWQEVLASARKQKVEFWMYMPRWQLDVYIDMLHQPKETLAENVGDLVGSQEEENV